MAQGRGRADHPGKPAGSVGVTLVHARKRDVDDLQGMLSTFQNKKCTKNCVFVPLFLTLTKTAGFRRSKKR